MVKSTMITEEGKGTVRKSLLKARKTTRRDAVERVQFIIAARGLFLTYNAEASKEDFCQANDSGDELQIAAAEARARILMQELKLPQKLSRDFYGIGHHRLSRLINQNTRQSAKGGNGRSIKDDTIVTLDAFLDENMKDAEVGFPCLHRRQKLYLPHEITSYRMLWFRYSDWVVNKKWPMRSLLRKHS